MEVNLVNEKICVVSTKNRLCLFFPSRRCWQVSEPVAAIEKPCDDPCINHLEYWQNKKNGWRVLEEPPIQVKVRRNG